MSYTSPPNAIDQDVDRFYRIGRAVATSQDRPPTPLFTDVIQNNGATIGVLHWNWVQSAPDPLDTNTLSTADGACEAVARQANTMPNPVHSLISALRAAMSDCVQHNVIPIGISVHTVHETSYAGLMRNDGVSKVAVAQIAVTVIPKRWVQDHAANPKDVATDIGGVG